MAGLKQEIIDRAKIILKAIGEEHSQELVNKITLNPHKSQKQIYKLGFWYTK